jgi:hypothetical protein
MDPSRRKSTFLESPLLMQFMLSVNTNVRTIPM